MRGWLRGKVATVIGELFSQSGLAYLARWLHFVAGITWIGLLYYFNLVQVPAFAQMDAAARTDALRKVTARALWWFKWSSLVTLLAGITILGMTDRFIGQSKFADYIAQPSGMIIYTGALIGTIMAANVWMVIWPNQRVVLANADATATGGAAIPEAAASGRRALIASRSNAVFSIALLGTMGGASHFSGNATAFNQAPDSSARMLYWIGAIVVIGLVELNAVGVFGGVGPGLLRKPLETVRSAIISSIVGAVVLLAWWAIALAP